MGLYRCTGVLCKAVQSVHCVWNLQHDANEEYGCLNVLSLTLSCNAKYMLDKNGLIVDLFITHFILPVEGATLFTATRNQIYI